MKPRTTQKQTSLKWRIGHDFYHASACAAMHRAILI